MGAVEDAPQVGGRPRPGRCPSVRDLCFENPATAAAPKRGNPFGRIEQHVISTPCPEQAVHDNRQSNAPDQSACRSGLLHHFRSTFSLKAVGRAKPVAMIQIKPGNRVNGISGSAFGNKMSSQLSSPTMASTVPRMTIHFGRILAKPAVNETPAINRPSGTEKPGPPKANCKR